MIKTLTHNNVTVAYSCQNSLTIYDSCKIKSIKDMRDILLRIKERSAVTKRSIGDMILEWRAHNLLYSLGLFKDRTRDVDLEADNKWYIKVAYFILSVLYMHF